MPCIVYDTTILDRLKRNPVHLGIVREANRIIAAMERQGFDLTLRQLYYQFVAHDLFPADRTYRQQGGKWVPDAKGTKNAEPNYKWLGDILQNARYAGLIDWESMVDRTRFLRSLAHWTGPSSIVRDAAGQYRLDKWSNQDTRIEVWIEKDALVGVIGGICNELDLGYFSCRGYTSASELWNAAQRLRGYADQHQQPVVLHFGDHDPSGIDMSRDIEARLGIFAETPIEVRRLALTMEQVREFDPPPNPAKLTDSRCAAYMEQYGDESWELDALEPSVIVRLIRDAVEEYRDADKWDELVEIEDEQRGELRRISDHYTDVVERLA